MRITRRVTALAMAWIVASCGSSVTPAPTPTPTSAPAQPPTSSSPAGLLAPFAAGITAQVIHGYNDPLAGETCSIGTASDHCQNQKDGFDFGLPAGSDDQILAPADGIVALELPLVSPGPGASQPAGPCLLLTTADGYNINLCHFGAYAVSEKQTVQRGCVLGTRNTSWIHMSIDDRHRDPSKPPVAFIAPHALQGVDYPEKAATVRDQYGPSDTSASVTSTNTARTCGSAPIAGPTATPTPTPTPGPVLSGTWVSPKAGATVKTLKLKLSAKPTASLPDVTLTKVVYSIAWGSKAPKTACTATKAATDGSWACTADLSKIGAPPGALSLSFDVFDDAGDVSRSPDGTRTVSFAPTPQPPVTAKATMVGPSGDCSLVTAAIDDASRYHLAASCDGRIRYSEYKAGGWKTITFKPPSDRLEVGPQLAFDGNTLYLAYTRVAPDEGCGGGFDDIGAYYRTRSGEGSAWSNPVRIGGSGDELFSLRVSDGVINVTVLRGSDLIDQYETVKGTVFHHYPISDANGFVSLRLASNGGARVVYESSRGIEYGSFNGQAFTRSLISKQDGYKFGPILVLDSGNHAHVVWTHAPPPGGCAEPEASPKDGTYYATNQSGSWKVERLTRVVGDTSLQVDTSNGKVYVLVAGSSLHEFTRSTSGAWSGETLAKVLAQSPVLRRDASTGRSLIAFIEHVDPEKRSGVYIIVRR